MTDQNAPRPATVEVAYSETILRLAATNERFRELLAARILRVTGRAVDWTDVGDLARIRERIEEVNTFLAGEAR